MQRENDKLFASLPYDTAGLQAKLREIMVEMGSTAGRRYVFLVNGISAAGLENEVSQHIMMPVPQNARYIIFATPATAEKIKAQAKSARVSLEEWQLEPMPDAQRAAVVAGACEEFGLAAAAVGEPVTGAILAKPGGHMPLYLRLACALLRGPRSIAACDVCNVGDVVSMPDDIAGLVGAICDQLEERHGIAETRLALSIVFSLYLNRPTADLTIIANTAVDGLGIELPAMSEEKMTAILADAVGTLLTPRPNRLHTHLVGSSLVRQAVVRRYGLDKTPNLYNALLAKALARILQDEPNNMSVVSELPRHLEPASGGEVLVQLMRNWELVHRMIRATQIPQLMDAFERCFRCVHVAEIARPCSQLPTHAAPIPAHTRPP